jgi:hypothetical protein
MPAFHRKGISDKTTLNLNVFAPPATGENDCSQGDDWADNYYAELKKAPEFRIRYEPTATV